MVYKWAEGARISVSAQMAGEAVAELNEQHGGSVTPELLIEASEADEAPLHGYFEWNDELAANEHRKDQARYLIRSIRVIQPSINPDVQDRPMRAFVSVVRHKEAAYMATATVMTDAALRGQVLDKAARELEAWRQRYAELKEFAEVYKAIEQVQLKIAV